jgi:succinyl-diaminopimelate desuccinylase
MKGGLAAMLLAARTIAISKMELAGDLVLALSAGEEVDMLGANVLVTHPKLQNLQGMLVAEPTSNELVIAEKGILWLEITTTGKTAHGSMPEYGRNAIEMMLTFIHELNQLDFISVEHPLLGKFSRSLNTIQGGIQTNVVPDQCKITLDMRTVPGQEHSAIIKQINELIATLKTKDPGFSASLRSTQAGPALSTQADDPMVKLIGQVINHVSGVTPTPKGVRYFTDAAIYAPRIHAPLVICGPGKAEMAHQPDEYIEIDKLIQAAKIYSLIGYHLLK